ncbi:hypothetical protein HK102_000352, partial [Quaeritorhiza haematococci]
MNKPPLNAPPPIPNDADLPSRPSSYLPPRLTVIITTSPVPSNPSTEILESVLKGLESLEGVEGVRFVVVFDGFKVHDDEVGGSSESNSGRGESGGEENRGNKGKGKTKVLGNPEMRTKAEGERPEADGVEHDDEDKEESPELKSQREQPAAKKSQFKSGKISDAEARRYAQFKREAMRVLIEDRLRGFARYIESTPSINDATAKASLPRPPGPNPPPSSTKR